MSIHEQITALLDGELVDAVAVDELLHVLAVSPEKRELLVDQLSLKRRYAASSSAVVPPAAADLAIMRGLGAIDLSMAAAPTGRDAVAAPLPLQSSAGNSLWRPLGTAAAAVLLLLGAYGAGYWSRGDGAASIVGAPVASDVISKSNASALIGARDTIVMLADQLAAMRSSSASAATNLASTSTTSTALVATRVPRTAGRGEVATRSRVIAANGAEAIRTPNASDDEFGSTTLAANLSDRLAHVESRSAVPPTSPTRDHRMTADVVRAPRTIERDASGITSASSGPIGVQVGFRNHARLSLPRVYGLSPAPTILSDREVLASYELGGDEGAILTRLRAGAAFGQTQFGMVFHTNTGGEAVDSIIEQSPQAFYGRAYLAPEVVRFDRSTGMLEVGGGYSEVGGFGTVGLNFEYRPIDELAFHVGASSWLLWTRYNNAVNLSTNVNGHIGVMLGF